MPFNPQIFYSWQSDRPNSACRSFIQISLEQAIKRIRKDDAVDLSPVLDRDTAGIGGSPAISDSIFDKISLCDIFVADLSIINSLKRFRLPLLDIALTRKNKRLTPNPNVLIELGFAIPYLGWDRILLVQNTIYGTPEDLPFDLRGRRIVTYTASENQGDKKSERDSLSRRLESELRHALELLSSPWSKPADWEPRWWGFWDMTATNDAYGGTLFIREVGSKGFIFHLDVWNGSHLGSCSGFARFSGKYSAQAFLDPLPGSNDKPCRVDFVRKASDPFALETVEFEGCRPWHGMGASFDGPFHRRQERLFECGFLSELDLQRLYSISGQYFLPMMQRFSGCGEDSVTDGDSATKAYFGLVRGMARDMTGIILKGANGELWAAYTDDDAVRYFTTEPADKTKPPATIENWREPFREKALVTQSDIKTIPSRWP